MIAAIKRARAWLAELRRIIDAHAAAGAGGAAGFRAGPAVASLEDCGPAPAALNAVTL